QESGRISMEFLARSVRKAGYMGCAGGIGNFSSIVKASAYNDGEFEAALNSFDGNSGLIGYENVTDTTGTPLGDAGIVIGTAEAQMISGTDALSMQGVRPCSGGKVVGGGTGSAQLFVENAARCGLSQNDIVIVANCDSAEAFGISNSPNTDPDNDVNNIAHGGNVNINPPFLSGTYVDDSYIYKPDFTFFYIGNGASGEPALYMKSLRYNAINTDFGSFEVAEGVEDMQLLFGEDTNGNQAVNRYVTADLVTDWNSVLAVRSCLEIRSQDRAVSDAQTYKDCAGNDVTAADVRFRKAYQTTVAIRNRVN
ncbi:hypothetical protein A3744_25475, partial [Oleiphilus sp. HI0073]